MSRLTTSIKVKMTTSYPFGDLFIKRILLGVFIFCITQLPRSKSEQSINRSINVYKSYQTFTYCTASAPIQQPEDVDSLQKIIQDAIASNLTVKLFGSRHSITEVICTEGVPVFMGYLNYTYFADPDNETVTVGSGAELLDVLEFLHESGRSLIHVPAFGGITVGGAIGTGAHGSSLLHPTTLSDQIVGVTVIDGLGQLRSISDSEDIKAFRVHLGLLGAIVDVTLKTVPLFKMTVINYPDSESILLDGTVLAAARVHDWYQLWWFPSSKQVVVSKGNYTGLVTEDGDEIVGNAVTNLIPDISPAEIMSGRESFERFQATKNLQAQYGFEDFTKYSLYREVVGKPPIFTEQLQNGSKRFVNPATGFAHRLQTNRCSNKCAWNNGENNSIYPEESAMAFEVNELPNVIIKMKQILEIIPAAFVMIGVMIRFSRASDGLMSIGAARDSVHIEWTTPMRFDPYSQPRDQIGAYQAILQAMVHDHGGRPHWGKTGPCFFTQNFIRKTVPPHLLKDFHAAMQKYDPNGVFLNKFGRRILLQSDELIIDPNVKRCALQDNCICQKNADCGDLQMCIKLKDKFPVCRDMIPAVGIPHQPIIAKVDFLNVSSIRQHLL